MGLFDSSYEQGRTDAETRQSEQSNPSLSDCFTHTVEDLANIFAPSDYKDGWDDGMKNNE